MNVEKLSNNPFVWLLLILALLEALAYLLLPYTQQPIAADVLRNPTTWRGWPEYLRAPSLGVSGKKIAIIGNSQAVGREMRDPGDIYVAHLRRLAREQALPLTIENWSLEGIRLAEIELLTMQAVKRQLDLLVIIVSPGNLDRGGSYNLDFGASDVDLIAGDPALWNMLLDSGLRRRISIHDVLKRGALLHSNVVRSRIAVHDVTASWLDPRWDSVVFGQRKNRIAHLRIGESRGRSASLPRQRRTMPAAQWRQYLEVHRRPAFDTLFASLQRRLRATGVDLLWVWMPLPGAIAGESALAGTRRFQQDICRTIEASGFACADLSSRLPDDHFLPLFQWTHLNHRGHRRFAAILFPLLRDAIHQL